jgi:hypothetical protein
VDPIKHERLGVVLLIQSFEFYIYKLPLDLQVDESSALVLVLTNVVLAGQLHLLQHTGRILKLCVPCGSQVGNQCFHCLLACLSAAARSLVKLSQLLRFDVVLLHFELVESVLVLKLALVQSKPHSGKLKFTLLAHCLIFQLSMNFHLPHFKMMALLLQQYLLLEPLICLPNARPLLDSCCMVVNWLSEPLVDERICPALNESVRLGGFQLVHHLKLPHEGSLLCSDGVLVSVVEQ